MPRRSLLLILFAGGICVFLVLRTSNPFPGMILVAVGTAFVLWLWSPSGTAWRDAVLANSVNETDSSARPSCGWFLAGFILLGSALSLLEMEQPYYFTQDDALVCELPTMLVGCRGVWHGIWPNYNPYTFMGSPLANLGMYSLTYPPTYVAYAVARHLLADEYSTLEVFAILHLVVGYAIIFGLMRQMRVSAAVAAMVALSVILSGSALIMGRSWHAFVPLFVWLPVLTWGLVRLCQGPVAWCWVAAMASAIGMTFHVGFPQMSIWVTGFFVLTTVMLTYLGEAPVQRAYLALPALLIGAGIALPIALPQMRAAEGIGPRFTLNQLPLPDAWVCMVAPYPLGQAAHPNDWGTFDRDKIGQMYFFGGLLGALFFANVLALIASGFHRDVRRGQFWCIMALVTLFMMQGHSAWLWVQLMKLPVVGRVNNHPFRLLPFFVLFASIAGGLVLERTLRLSRRRRAWEVLLGAILAGLLLYHAWLARPSFYTYPIQPYPNLPGEMNSILGLPGKTTGRLMAWSRIRSTHPEIGYSLFNALPGLYGMPAFDGYDPVVENTFPHAQAGGFLENWPHQAARAYGLRWHLTVRGLGPIRASDAGLFNMEGTPPYERAFRALDPLGLPRVFESGAVLLTTLGDVDPLAFVEGQTDRALPLELHAGGIDLDASAVAGTTVIVNFLWRPEMCAFVDGEQVTCEHDDWLRMRVGVPVGAKKLEIRYAPSWTLGLLWGGASILVGLGLLTRMRWSASAKSSGDENLIASDISQR